MAIIVLPLLSKIRTKVEIIAAVKQEEEHTAYLLNSFPDGYKLIKNAVISCEGRKSEINNVVIGTIGVFVIETKNIRDISPEIVMKCIGYNTKQINTV